ncbi:SCO1860 family LAETG-anchored protein [Streptomyces griseocarneus]|uniref:SCO1860 family LAETG-anchored protein n=1 Tax=Streptomyces griseocarneus TaxID=51201 RepID=UPI00167D0694
MPARRFTTLAATATATALALGATPAHATGPGAGEGKATATVLRTGLDVSLLGGTAHVPVNAVLNDVRAPADAHKAALAVTLDGVEGGRPVTLLRAEAATSRATTDRHTAQGRAELLHATVHVPGLPLRSLIEVEKVTAEAVCAAGRTPTATAKLPGSVSVLGKKVTIGASGTTKVTVPGVGEVRLELSKTATTSRTAAATALGLDVAIDPLALGVAKVRGTVTLVRAGCEAPAAPTTGSQDATTGGTDIKPQTAARGEAEPAAAGLAETGGSSTTPYLAGGAGLLVVAGGGALYAVRRRRSARG